jgi:hypothetical protein
MKQPGRGSALFCIAVGVLMFVSWTVLLATGQVPGISENALAFAFHWTAELLTAIALILAGVAILRGATFRRRLYYFATGLLVIGAAGAIVYYIGVEPEPVAVVGLSIIVASAKVLAWRSREDVSDLLFFVLGVVLYGELNVLGHLFQSHDTAAVPYLLIMTAVTLPFTVYAFKKPL